jgi:Xaa-Pro aminopeptidase
MSELLLYGDTERSPALRHELPLAIRDPLLYAERDGRVYVLVSSLERDRVARARPDAELLDPYELGLRELLEGGLGREQAWLEINARAVARIGLRRALVEFAFPLGLAERLRTDGLELLVADEQIRLRRRAKSAAELEGIRRAQRAAEAGMAAAAGLLRTATVRDGLLLGSDGEPLTAEAVRAALRAACARHGALAPPDAIVASVRQGYGHEPGSGPLPAGLPITIDLWPRDEASGCFADMTRTFVAGGLEPPAEVRRQERLVREALEEVRAAARPGVSGRELHALACEVFEREGYRTQRTGPGEDRAEGFQFSLGHGVGLEVHEDPSLGLGGHAPLLEGDVVALEPGLWQGEVGGMRFEDLVLITASGCETLTRYPYSLEP